jgi:membrane protein DedA with SNARE-associated domain
VLFPVRVRANTTVLWTVVLFLGGSLLFRSLRNATEDSETWVAVLVQVGALVVLIGAVVLVVRRLR